MFKIIHIFKKNKIIYARSTTDFKDLAVGMVLEMYSDENAEDHVKEYKQWQLINHAAKTDAGLQKALERIKILYYLRDTNGT